MDADQRHDAPDGTEGSDPTVPSDPAVNQMGGRQGSDPPRPSDPQDGEPEAAVTQADGSGGSDPSVPEPDYKDLYLRSAAETDNVRKRARRDVEAAQARGVAKLARELLPALDNLDRAIAAAEAQEGDTEHHLTKGIRLVQQELLGAMARVGIEPYSPEGEAFDPHHHEAIAQQPTEGAESGTVVVVLQPGYRLVHHKDEVLLRAAKVVVAA